MWLWEGKFQTVNIIILFTSLVNMISHGTVLADTEDAHCYLWSASMMNRMLTAVHLTAPVSFITNVLYIVLLECIRTHQEVCFFLRLLSDIICNSVSKLWKKRQMPLLNAQMWPELYHLINEKTHICPMGTHIGFTLNAAVKHFFRLRSFQRSIVKLVVLWTISLVSHFHNVGKLCII